MILLLLFLSSLLKVIEAIHVLDYLTCWNRSLNTEGVCIICCPTNFLVVKLMMIRRDDSSSIVGGGGVFGCIRIVVDIGGIVVRIGSIALLLLLRVICCHIASWWFIWLVLCWVRIVG